MAVAVAVVARERAEYRDVPPGLPEDCRVGVGERRCMVFLRVESHETGQRGTAREIPRAKLFFKTRCQLFILPFQIGWKDYMYTISRT